VLAECLVLRGKFADPGGRLSEHVFWGWLRLLALAVVDGGWFSGA